jgi:predicted transcriptional regulator
MPKKLIEIASEIVQTQVSLTPMTPADIVLSLRQVFSTLQELQRSETAGIDIELSSGPETTPEESAESKLAPVDSIQENKIVCLECGSEMKQLTQKHLASHGISPKDYKRKYGFSMKTPLAARSLTKSRSKAAKKRGLPENLKKFHEERRQEKAQSAQAAIQAAAAAGKPKRATTAKRV